MGKGLAGELLELVAEEAEGAKAGADLLGVVGEGCHGHEAIHLELRQGEDLGKEGFEGVGGKAVLGSFARSIDLKENSRGLFGASGGDLLGELEGVNGVDEGEVANGFGYFFPLEGADEVPLDVGGQLGLFFERLSKAVFPEVAVPIIVELLNLFNRPLLGDSDDGDPLKLDHRISFFR